MSDDWFEDWFGEEYLALYEHRHLSEARKVVSLIARHVGSLSDAPVLDLACGAGRHQRMLCDRGWWTIALDLSPSLLHAARTADLSAPLVRADMRSLPFADASFSLIVNLFTSFGYFRDDAQHLLVLREVARVARSRGWCILDYLKAEQVRDSLVSFDARRVGRLVVEQEREIVEQGRFVKRTITIGELGRAFVERVRLFRQAELDTLCAEAGFHVDAVYGDYQGGLPGPDSPLMILFARRQ